ncbi:MAG: TIGR04053 family radical SAM/SPASM domain-containing protein [Bryobacterales bacterium]|nr:TIGR04053 family radical SAM/SPASM domain-containing protein [Bryobacterales bacterium]
MKDYSDSPFLVIWEVTQACDLACRHCRATAQPSRHPAELTTEEGFRLLDQVKGFGHPLMVFTGGDPLKRPDLLPLLRYSTSIGLRTTVTPSATPLLTPQAIAGFKTAGVCRIALSVDGADAGTHDRFRGVEGSYALTMRGFAAARAAQLETQVNTTVTRGNLHQLPRIAELVEQAGARMWSVFFLVTTGRAVESDDLTAEEYEQVFAFLYELGTRAPFDIKTTEAPHYRRYVSQRKRAEGLTSSATRRMMDDSPAVLRQAGIRDGKGLLFVSHAGDIFPSGFLPVSAGNLRTMSLADAYRNTPLFQVLRDSDALGGKCGDCNYRHLCGGSRARALAVSGDYMAEEPRCSYQPSAAQQPGSAHGASPQPQPEGAYV